jgi:hypothetical protein
MPHRRKFRFRLHAIHNLQPIGGAGQRPVVEDLCEFYAALAGTSQTRPSPVFRRIREAGAERIPFHITHHIVEMLVGLNGETLVPALIQMPVADRPAICLPAFDMSVGKLPHKRCELAVSFWPQHEMPMIRHQCVRAHAHWQDS